MTISILVITHVQCDPMVFKPLSRGLARHRPCGVGHANAVESEPMGPSTEDLFCLNVFVEDVELVSDNEYRREVNGLALACRFLDYPLFFIHPQVRHERSPRCTFNTGKSCALSETKSKLSGIISKVRHLLGPAVRVLMCMDPSRYLLGEGSALHPTGKLL